MFKSWQIFVFSLVPLALVFAGVIIGSMPGLDSDRQAIPTAPAESGNGEGTAPTAVPGATQLQLVASDLAWDTTSLTAPAGTAVQLAIDNQDASVPHNFSLYADQGYTQSVFTGDLITGPAKHTYSFDSPATAGQYFFRCDVHTDMTGQFTVN